MFLERYEFGELLAEAERNTVRRVRRLSDGARLVIKTSTGDYPSVKDLRKLEFEYDLLVKLNTPGVIAAVGLERQSGRVALVLEDFGGERLPIRPGKGMSLAQFLPLGIGIVRALGQVHGKDIIHKDINPRNVLMNPSTGEVKLIDFSLASELRREHLAAMPQTELEGTLPYMSPEQTGRMNRDLDYRTDYYSLGVTFFELLTGYQPFSAPDVLGYIHCHLSKPVPSPREQNPEVPEGVAGVVLKLMAKNQDDRYQSARGLLADLEHCQRTFESTGTVPLFPVGREDISERFQVSQELLGRQAEAETLLHAFDEAAAGPMQVLFVAGYSGIGKSTLVAEIHRPVVEKRAHFLVGKFEQFERNTPYAALVEALRGYLKLVLTEPERHLVARRESFAAALGGDAGVLTPLLPELASIMGPQPALAELSGRESQARLHRVFRSLIGAIASLENPLVLFLDDLQWTDSATAQLLLHLASDERLRHVFIIGAYRDNEVGPGHLLTLALDELKAKRPERVHVLSLQPLPESVVAHIVASTLHAEPVNCAAVSRLMYQQTAGNPFFLHELLNLLYREGAIEFSAERGSWLWHDEQIARAAVSDNVVDLMVRRLRQLAPETLECLRVAACLGKEFDLSLVARLMGKTRGAVATALWQAVEQRLVAPKGAAYRLLRRDGADDGQGIAEVGIAYQFPHDRVLEAAYSLLASSEKSALHLQIGRMLKERVDQGALAERVFDFIDHLNHGRAHIVLPAERAELAELNQTAAQRARRSAAYASAIAYLDVGESLLSAEEWQTRRAQRFDMARVKVECIFLSGQVDAANRACEELFDKAPDQIARAAAFCLQADTLLQQGRLIESIDVIRKGLGELGVDLPAEPALVEREIGLGMQRLQAHLERVCIEDLAQLPPMTDALRKATSELLAQLIPPASQANPPLFILAELILFDLALTHGTVPGTAWYFMACGMVLAGILNRPSEAYRLGKVGFTLLQPHTPTPLESAVNFVFGCFISHWGAHFQEGLDALARGHQRGVELGDMIHASYSVVHRVKTLLFCGRELADCQTETERALAFTEAAGAVGHMAVPRIVRRALGQLSGTLLDSSDFSLSDADFIKEMEKTENSHFLLVLGQTQTLVNLVLGDLERASQWDEFATKYIGVGNGAFPVPDYYLFQALILGRKWRTASGHERASIKARLEQHEATLKGFAAACPQNFSHKQLLVSAELARIGGASIDEVLRLHRAVVEASGNDFTHIRALSHEVLADFWRERGYPEFSRECLLEAYHLYRLWGAGAKLARLEREHGNWLNPAAAGGTYQPFSANTLMTATASSVDSGNLDVASAIKATLAISSEVKRERLFGVLMQTIIENVGAEHGYLILHSDESGDLMLVARASVGDTAPPAALSVPLEECTNLARDVIRYVARTRETLVLDDARKDETYRHDPHVRERDVKSVLCMPILNQGQLLAILYVENSALAHAFTPARLLFLRVIAGQAAVSIANAQLYDNLEFKVVERTRQLAEQSRKISAMLNSLEQGVFTIDDQLRIQPDYSAHLEQLLGTRDIEGRDCLELLLNDAGLNPEALANVRSALDFSFGAPLMFSESNKSHLVREFRRRREDSAEPRSFEVDWTFIGDGDDVVRSVLVAVRDVTLMKQMSARVAEHARELDFVGQILDAGVAHFQRFCSSARELLEEACRLMGAEADVSAATRARIFRSLHTIKGNARMLGFSHLAVSVHVAEESFDARHSVSPLDPVEMRGSVDSVLSCIDEYERVYQRKLVDVMHEPARGGDRLWKSLAARIREAQDGGVAPSDALAAIADIVRKAGAMPLSQIVKNGSRALPVLAQELGKLAPIVETEGGGLWLTEAWAEVLENSLVHAFQNAMDHGIEAVDERRRKRKPDQGKLTLRAVGTPRGTALHLTDDGRGLDLGAVRAKAGHADESDEQAAMHIFDAGVSTAERVTQISGRGVGLDAVRSSVRDLGGNVSIALTGLSDDGHRPFELVIELPSDAIFTEPLTRLPPSNIPGLDYYAQRATGK